MSKELKPCAHCGSELSEFCEDFYKVNRSGNDHWVYLRCLKCGAMTQGHGNTKEAAEQNARKRWNTRTEREVGISKLQKITGTSYLEAKSILTSLKQAGARVVE